jgi:hypothetical protein
MTAPRILGFDMGHAESALVLVPNPLRDRLFVSRLQAQRHRSTVVTAVATTTDRAIVIGAEAMDVREPATRDLDVKSNQLKRDAVRTRVRNFMTGIRDDHTRTRGEAEPGNTRWVLGVPTAWTETERTSLAEVAEEAGLTNVSIVLESRAAMIFARESGDVDVVHDDLTQAVLVVDLGSMTADYTLVKGLHATDHGSELGARLIDRGIAQWMKTHHPDAERLRAALLAEPLEEARFLFACRTVKEDFFSNQAGSSRPDDPTVFAGTVYAPQHLIGRQASFELKLTPEVMAQVLGIANDELGCRTWEQQLRKDLTEIRQSSGIPDLVLLTGGASRMVFVRKVSEEIFDGARVIATPEPELAIARGLALAGGVSYRAEGFRQDVDAMLAGEDVETAVSKKVPELATEIATVVTEDLLQRFVIPRFRQFRDGKMSTLAQLEQHISSDMIQALREDTDGRVRHTVQAWSSGLATDLRAVTDPICDRWRIDRSGLELSHLEITKGDNDLVDGSLATPMTDGVGDAAGVAAGIVGTVLAVIASIAIVVGPVTAVIGIILMIASPVGGLQIGIAAKERAQDWLRTWDMPDWARQRLSETRLSKACADQGPRIRAKLAESITEQSSLSLIEQVSVRAKDQLRRKARDAELLVAKAVGESHAG